MNAYKLLFKNDGWQQLVISLCWHKKPPKWVLSKSTHCIDQYSENGESPRNSVKIGRRVVDLQKLGRSQLRFPGISIHLLFILLFQISKKTQTAPQHERKLVRMSRNNPGTNRNQACHDLETAGTPASLSTVKQVLYRHERPCLGCCTRDPGLDKRKKIFIVKENKDWAVWP